MATKYHINSRGEARSCKAWSGNCPFGGEGEHYATSGIAREAYEAKMGSAFEPPILPSIKRGVREKIAATSSNPDELFAVAQKANERIVKALLSNPNATAETLMEARSKHPNESLIGRNIYFDLEQHPNYPKASFSKPGAHRWLDEHSIEEALVALSRDDVGYEFLDQASFKGNDLIKAGISNPNNQVPTYQRGAFGSQNAVFAKAAVASGKWPTAEDLEGKTKYWMRGETYNTGGSGWSTRQDKLRPPIVKIVAEESSNPEILSQVYFSYVKNFGDEGDKIVLALLNNPATPEETKQAIGRDVAGKAQLLRTQADNIEKLSRGEISPNEAEARSRIAHDPTKSVADYRKEITHQQNIRYLGRSNEEIDREIAILEEAIKLKEKETEND